MTNPPLGETQVACSAHHNCFRTDFISRTDPPRCLHFVVGGAPEHAPLSSPRHGLSARPGSFRRHNPKDAAERGAFDMARCGASGRVPEPVAHSAQFANRRIQFVGFCRRHLAVDARLAVPPKH